MTTIYNKVIGSVGDIPRDDRDEFEYFATYLVTQYYGTLFKKAEDYLRSHKAKTLTECYRLAITNFSMSMQDEKNISAILRNFHEWYIDTTSRTLSYEECITAVVSACIPNDFYKKMNIQQKVIILRDLWITVVKNMTDFIYRHYISFIIDSRDDKSASATTISSMQDEIVNLLALKRDEYYDKFHSAIHGGGVSNEKISMRAVKKMKDIITKLAHEKAELTVRISSLEKIVYKMKEENDSLNEKCSHFEKENDGLKVELSTIRAELRVYRKRNGEPEDSPRMASKPNMGAPPILSKPTIEKGKAPASDSSSDSESESSSDSDNEMVVKQPDTSRPPARSITSDQVSELLGAGRAPSFIDDAPALDLFR